MFNNSFLPDKLKETIGLERVYFEVKSGRKIQGIKQFLTIIVIYMGLQFLTISGIFIFVYSMELYRLFSNMHSSFNVSHLILSLVFVVLFAFMGLILTFIGFSSFFQKAGFFVGTQTRLLQYYKGEVISVFWKQFSGLTEIKGKPSFGSLLLYFKTGTVINKEKNIYIPDVICIPRIKNVSMIEQICQKLIKENIVF